MELIQAWGAARGYWNRPGEVVVPQIQPVQIAKPPEAGRYASSEVVGVQSSENNKQRERERGREREKD